MTETIPAPPDDTATARYSDFTMRHIAQNRLWVVVATACGIKRQAPMQWDRVPSARVLTVEKLTKIPRHVIRPDLYPAPKSRSKQRLSS